jgi:hypothetical protein
MTAISVAVAQGMLTMLQTAKLSQDIAPERSYADWDLALEDADNLHVDVVAVTTEQKSELAVRGPSIQYIIPVDIAIRQRFGSDKQNPDTGRIEVASVDALCQLTEEIHELFMPNRLTDFSDGVWQETKILACPVLKHLKELRQFTGIVRVSFAVVKKLPTP